MKYRHNASWLAWARLALLGVLLTNPVTSFSKNALQRLIALERQGLRVGAFFAIGHDIIAQYRSDQRLNPASVSKVFTAGLALAVLGADTTFQTQVLLNSSKQGPILTIVGSGDPMLSSSDLEALAGCVKEKGIAEVSTLIVDTGPFNQEILPPAFERKATDAPYRAGVAGLQVDFNRILVTVKPSRPGRPALVSVEPASDYVRIVNKAVTVSGKKQLPQVTLRQGNGYVVVHVAGKISHQKPLVIAKRVPDPARHAGYVFMAFLRKAGIKIKGEPTLQKAPGNSEALCTHVSPPVKQMLFPLLKESQNQVAESLLRLCGVKNAQGKPVGFREGIQVLDDFLARVVKLEKSSYLFRNGSGLYDANLVTTKAVVQFLQFLEQKLFIPVISALPVAGKDGTLRKRFKGTLLEGRLRAKTGTLDNVVSLAGYFDLTDGKTVAFAVIVEGTKKIPAAKVRRTLDLVILDLAKALTKSTNQSLPPGLR